MIPEDQKKCRVLIVDNNDDIRAGLANELGDLGLSVTIAAERSEGLALENRSEFELLISDLLNQAEAVRSFKMSVTNSSARCGLLELHNVIERTLGFKLRHIDDSQPPKTVREKIDLELPSDLTLMNSVLEYLLDRVEKLGMVAVEQSNLFVALDEAFVNAVKHGNRNDPQKLLRVTAELSPHEAIFTVEDEGDGFDVRDIPDPTDSQNLFKSTGRGVLLIYNIMDEVEYSQGGAKLRMVKRPQNGAEAR